MDLDQPSTIADTLIGYENKARKRAAARSFGSGPLDAVSIERKIEALLDGLILVPMLVRATAREVINTKNTEGRYTVTLTLLRWREEVVSQLDHVNRLIEQNLQRSHPDAHITIEGWWFAGDAVRPAGPISKPGGGEAPHLLGRDFMPTVPNPLVDHDLVRLNF